MSGEGYELFPNLYKRFDPNSMAAQFMAGNASPASRHEEGATLESSKGIRRKSHVDKISIVRKFARSLGLRETARGKTTDVFDIAGQLTTFLEYEIDKNMDFNSQYQKDFRKREKIDGETLYSVKEGDDTLDGDVRIFYTKLYVQGIGATRMKEELPSGIAIDALHLRMGSQWVVNEGSRGWNESRHLLEEYAGYMNSIPFNY
jgi:hypothetical protein